VNPEQKLPTFHLLGHPVGHSLSPVIHEAAYAALGREARYSVLDCPDRSAVELQVNRLRQGEIAGLNATVPHKKLALELADEVDPLAARIQAANVLARTERGTVRAYNTDAPALAEELRALATQQGAALVLGTGGAALAAVESAVIAGFAPVFVTGRRYTSHIPEAQWPEAAQVSRLGAQPVLWPAALGASSGLGEFDARQGEFERALAECAIVIQATSAGMKGSDSGEELARMLTFSPEQAYYDLVYNPELTPFLRAARDAGARASGGLGMLVLQAAMSIEIWWGVRPPLAPLYARAEAELARRAAK
jgi:shikimate dehydrogenase